MPAVSITPDDLAPFATIDAAKAWAMIEDAMAMAATEAPFAAYLALDARRAIASLSPELFLRRRGGQRRSARSAQE